MGTTFAKCVDCKSSKTAPIQSADIGKSGADVCPSPAIEPPYLKGVGAPAPISTAYTSLNVVAQKAQEKELKETLVSNAYLLEYGYNTGAFTDSDIHYLNSDAPASDKINALSALLPTIPYSGNALLQRQLDTFKATLVVQGFNPDFIQRAIETNDMSFGFTLAEDNTPAFCMPDLMVGITYPFHHLQGDELAATALLYKLLKTTDGCTPSQAIEAMHPVELASFDDIDALKVLLGSHKDTKEKSNIYEWFYGLARFLKKHDPKLTLGEHFFFRAEEMSLEDLIKDPKSTLDKVQWLEDVYDVAYSILSESLVYSTLTAEEKMIRNTNFKDVLVADSSHAKFLLAIENAFDSIAPVEGNHFLECITDFWGVPYAHIPFEHSRERAEFFDLADETYRFAMEAGEMALIFKILDFEVAFKHFESQIQGSLLCSMLRLYAETQKPDADCGETKPFA